MRRSAFTALTVGLLVGLGAQWALAQPVNGCPNPNMTCQGIKSTSVKSDLVDAGNINVAGRIWTGLIDAGAGYVANNFGVGGTSYIATLDAGAGYVPNNLGVGGLLYAGTVDAGALNVANNLTISTGGLNIAGANGTNIYGMMLCNTQNARIGADCTGASDSKIEFYSGPGNKQWLIDTSGVLTANAAQNATTAGTWTSTIASGSNGFSCSTEGCRFAIGPDTNVEEQGTRLRKRDGTDGTAGSGTGYTTNQTNALAHAVHKLTIINTALDAAATSDETIWTVPAKTRVLRMIADVTTTFSGGALTDVDVTCGTTAGGNQYLLSFDVDTATGTYGGAAAEIGAGLLSATVADIPSWSATTAVQCRFTCTGANCSVATQGSMTLYIEHLVYP